MLLWWGDFLMSDLVKISVMAEEMEVSYKTIYNWISNGDLAMPIAGYVSRHDTYESQRAVDLRTKIQRLEASEGIKRDSKGRWISG